MNRARLEERANSKPPKCSAMARDIHMQARARGFMIVPVVSSVISSPPVVDPVVDNARDVARLDAVFCNSSW